MDSPLEYHLSHDYSFETYGDLGIPHFKNPQICFRGASSMMFLLSFPGFQLLGQQAAEDITQ